MERYDVTFTIKNRNITITCDGDIEFVKKAINLEMAKDWILLPLFVRKGESQERFMFRSGDVTLIKIKPIMQGV